LLECKVDYTVAPPALPLSLLPNLLSHFRRPAAVALACALALAAPFVAAADGGGSSNMDTPLPSPAPATSASGRIGAALKAGDRTQALQIADEFLASNPRDAQVRFLRAVILGDLNRVEEAEKALESLTEDFPELAEPYNNLAVLRAGQGQLSTAEHYLQLAIAAQPNYLTARENLGDLYLALAVAAYEQALQRNPDNAALQRKLRLTRELGGKLRSAQ